MNHRLHFVISILLIISIVLLGCSTSKVSEEPIAVNELTVTFEPEKCIYDGPKTILQGEIAFTLDNHTESLVDLRISKLQEGKSWQDLVDSFKETNQSISYPKWVSLVSFKPKVSDLRVKIFTLEPGMYSISCTETLQGSWAIWLASPLEVK